MFAHSLILIYFYISLRLENVIEQCSQLIYDPHELTRRHGIVDVYRRFRRSHRRQRHSHHFWNCRAPCTFDKIEQERTLSEKLQFVLTVDEFNQLDLLDFLIIFLKEITIFKHHQAAQKFASWQMLTGSPTALLNCVVPIARFPVVYLAYRKSNFHGWFLIKLHHVDDGFAKRHADRIAWVSDLLKLKQRYLEII